MIPKWYIESSQGNNPIIDYIFLSNPRQINSTYIEDFLCSESDKLNVTKNCGREVENNHVAELGIENIILLIANYGFHRASVVCD